MARGRREGRYLAVRAREIVHERHLVTSQVPNCAQCSSKTHRADPTLRRADHAVLCGELHARHVQGMFVSCHAR